MAEAAAPERQLKRTLGALDLTCHRDWCHHWGWNFRAHRNGSSRSGVFVPARDASDQFYSGMVVWRGVWYLGGPGRVRRLLFHLLWRESHAVLLRFAMRN